MKFLNIFTNLLPSNCQVCGRILYDKHICTKCSSKLNNTANLKAIRRCKTCFKMLSDLELEYCLTCQLTDIPFRYIRYLWEYKELESIFIKKMKYSKSSFLLNLASNYLISNYEKLFYGQMHDIIIPAFSSVKSLKERGYLHTYYLAKKLYKHILRYKKDVILASYCNFPNTYYKKALSPMKLRLRYLPIHINLDLNTIKNKKILFIDDMITTGSSALNLQKTLLCADYEAFDVYTLGVASDFYENFEKSIMIYSK